MKYNAKSILTFSSLACLISLSGCAIGKGRVNPDDYIVKPEDKIVLSFVATTKTVWDTSVSFGGKGFNIEMNLMGDNKLTLTGTHKKAEATAQAAKKDADEAAPGDGEGQGSGSDDNGGENQGSENTGGEQTGGEQTGGEQTGGENQGSENTGGDTGGNTGGENQGSNSGGDNGGGQGGGNNGPTLDEGDWSFTISGTWELEEGWGYVLSLQDEDNTKLYVDYDVDTGRHYTYYTLNPTIDGQKWSSTQVQLQAKDAPFRNKLNDDYVIHEERVADYVFHGGGFDSMTGNKIEALLYLEKDGTACSLTSSGSSDTYTMGGSWSEDTTKHQLTINIGGSTYTTSGYCDIAGQEGYRLSYSSSVCYGPKAGSSKAWYDYTLEDFDGKTLYTFEATGYELVLTEKNKAILLKGSSTVATYDFKFANDVFTVSGGTDFPEEVYTSVLVNGEYKISVFYNVVGMSNSLTKTEVTLSMAKA